MQAHLDKCPYRESGNPKDCSCEDEVAHYTTLAKYSLGLFLFEIIGGIFSGSLALISDALHVLFDSIENIISIAVSRMSRVSANEKMVREVAGKISAILLMIGGFIVAIEGYDRINNPHEINGWIMLFFTTVGLGVNVRQLYLHRNARDEHRNITHFWQDKHLISDTATSVAVLIGGIIILISEDWAWLDGALSLAIGILIILFTIAKFCGLNIHTHDHKH